MSSRFLQTLSILPHHHPALWSGAQVLPTLVSSFRLRTSIVTTISLSLHDALPISAPLLPYHSQPHRDCLPLFPDSALVTPQCRSITKLEAAAGVLPAASPLRLSRVLLQLRSDRKITSLNFSHSSNSYVVFGLQILPTLVSACRLRTSIVTAISSLRLVLRQEPPSFPTRRSSDLRDCLPLFPDSALVTPQCRSITKLEAAAGVLPAASPLRLSRVLLQLRSDR